MKKTLTILLTLCVVVLESMAFPVTRQQALQNAQAFLQDKGKAISTSRMRHAPTNRTATQQDNEPYYIFNIGEDEGFVVVAGDDLAPEILGYSTSGRFDINEAPENMKAWFEGYADQIEYLRKHPSAKIQETTNYDEILPLIKTKWDQGDPYNRRMIKYKDDEDGRMPTGCTATALAQLMCYYKWPKGETATIPAYTANANIFGVNKYAEFDELKAITFDWNNMFNEYIEGEFSNEQADAVATLMQYCAQIAKTDYTVKDDKGKTKKTSTAFYGNARMELFGYKTTFKERILYELLFDDWEKVIYDELKKGNPVCYGGTREYKEDGKEFKSAHAFIVNGYAYDGLFYVNWGWSGHCDDHLYRLSVLNPIMDDGTLRYPEGGYEYEQTALFLEPSQDYAYSSSNYDFEKDGVFYKIVYSTSTTGRPGSVVNSRKKAPIFKGVTFITDSSKDKIIDHVEVTRGNNPYSGHVKIPSSVVIPASITKYAGQTVSVNEVEGYSFFECDDLDSVTIEGSVMLEDRAFYRCFNLKDVYVDTPYEISEDAFDSYNYETATLHVPEGYIETFKNLKGWKNFLNKIDAAGYSECGTTGDEEYVQFADKGFESLCVSNWDTNGDGRLSKEEAATVSDIGYTFNGDTEIFSLDELKYFTGLTSIPDYAFTGCENLSFITLPSGVSTIGEGAFWNCTSLSTIVMNEGLKEIKDGAFAVCPNLSNVVIPSTVTSIGEFTFQDCSNITSCNIPAGVTEIPYAAFVRCDNLKNISLPSGIQEIDDCAFMSCVSLTSINLPEGLKRIGDGAFCVCFSLGSVILPSSLESIGMQAFSDSGIEGLTIPANTENLGLSIVGYCPNLTSLTVDEGNRCFRSSGNGIIDRNTNMLVQSCTYTSFATDIDGVGDYGYLFISGVEEIVLPENIKRIGYDSFQSCIDLKIVTLPKALTTIGEEAFLDCQQLESVIVLNPEPVAIKENVFCKNMDYDETGVIEFTDATLYVPFGSKEKYKSAEGWKEFKTIIEMEEELPGDVNRDGLVGIGDIVAVTNVMAGNGGNITKERADVNGDGDVGIGDIVAITNYMAGIGEGSEEPDDNAYLTCPDGNHPHWIDMGLPSGTQWRCCNEGASTPEAFGGYYQFGQVSTAPTLDQIKELVDNCSYTWTTQNGVNGGKFSGPNGGAIFLPAAGYRWNGVLAVVDSYGGYWSSTLSDEANAYGLCFDSYKAWNYDNWLRQYSELSVRPVRQK